MMLEQSSGEISIDLSELEAPPDPEPAPRAPAPPRESAGVQDASTSPGIGRTPAKALASEGDDWSSYLDELAHRQGKVFETGFSGLDEALGGLGPGLMVLCDEDRRRRFSFLKQLTDQVASAGEMSCLYLAGELGKAALRLKTLSRLSGVAFSAIEKGKLDRGSPEWARIETEGRKASDWLKRVYVVEVSDPLSSEETGALVQQVLQRSGRPSCLVVVDSVERVVAASGAGAGVAALKALADQREVLVLGATSDPKLLASRAADLAAMVREEEDGAVGLEVLRAGNEEPAGTRFEYDAERCRFTESGAG